VILPYRHPLLLARMASNLDQLSDGRLILGVGVSWARAEFEALGIPFERRGRISDDCLSVLQAQWSHEVASPETRSVRFANVHTAPAPTRQPHPPIWVAGTALPRFSRQLASAMRGTRSM
jgi:alkanesulfonate monooxygenase SsuD/methylene tetrahydromethanopterin reductase-like flavin-dependent oxidoreductase (luciferase family)